MKKCPNCDRIMNEVIKIDVLIDVCPQCMGIWLDKGELDKIIEHSRREFSESQREDYDDKYYSRNNYHHDDDHDDHDDHYYKNKHGYEHNPRKKRGGLGEIFGNLFD